MVHVSTHGLTIAPYVHGPSLDSQLICRTGMWGSTPRAKGTVEVHRLVDDRRTTMLMRIAVQFARRSRYQCSNFFRYRNTYLPSGRGFIHFIRMPFEGCVGLGSIGFRLGASHEGLRVRHYRCETRPFHERGAERGGTDIGLIARLGCVPPHRRIAQSYLSALYSEQTSPRVRSLTCFYKAVRLDVGAHTRRRAVSCCPVSVIVQPNLFDLYCREVASNHLGQPAWAYPGQHRVPAFSVPLFLWAQPSS